MSKKQASETTPEETIENEDVVEPKKEKKKASKEDKLKQRIEELEQEVNTLNDRFLRNQAELQNFKRRINDERIKDRKYANLELVKNILTPLDNLEIGLSNERVDGELKPHIKGFEMIRRDLMEVLKEDGLEIINPENEPFDPNYHQAVSKEPKEDTDSNIVIEVYQKGYMFKDRVIRPAMVKVSE